MYAELPENIKMQVKALLANNEFQEAKRLHDQWLKNQAQNTDNTTETNTHVYQQSSKDKIG